MIGRGAVGAVFPQIAESYGVLTSNKEGTVICEIDGRVLVQLLCFFLFTRGRAWWWEIWEVLPLSARTQGPRISQMGSQQDEEFAPTARFCKPRAVGSHFAYRLPSAAQGAAASRHGACLGCPRFRKRSVFSHFQGRHWFGWCSRFSRWSEKSPPKRITPLVSPFWSMFREFQTRNPEFLGPLAGGQAPKTKTGWLPPSSASLPAESGRAFRPKPPELGVGDSCGCGCQNRFGIPFWLGLVTSPPILEPVLVLGLVPFTGGTIWILTHGK